MIGFVHEKKILKKAQIFIQNKKKYIQIHPSITLSLNACQSSLAD